MRPRTHRPAPGAAQTRCCARRLGESESGAAQRAPPAAQVRAGGKAAVPKVPGAAAAQAAQRLLLPGLLQGGQPRPARQAAAVPRRRLSAAPRALQHAWPEHKRAHKPGPGSWLFCTKRGQARSMTMPEFRWTGPLRPAPISPRRPVRSLGFGAGAARLLRSLDRPPSARLMRGRRSGPAGARWCAPARLCGDGDPDQRAGEQAAAHRRAPPW